MANTVLVVEDNPLTRRCVRIALVAAGLQVVEAEGGTQALLECDRAMPDLVLLDLMLSDCSGMGLLTQLRARCHELPVVAFTGHTDEEPMRAAGFTDVLVKPVETKRLVETVQNHLRHALQIAMPRTNTRDRTWNAMTSILSGLTDLATASSSIEHTMRGALESMLDASGFMFGVAWTAGDDGLVRCAQVGWSDAEATRIARACERDDSFAEALETRAPVGVSPPLDRNCLFEDPRIASAIIIPLHHGADVIGTIMLASAVSLKSEWLALMRMISGPITQSLTLANTVARLSASEHRFRGIAETTADGIVLSGLDGVVTYLNPSAERLLGKSILGTFIESAIPFLDSGATTGNIFRGGHTIPIEVSQRSFEDGPGVVNRVYVLRDLSQAARIDELAHLANHDPLTGICNRRRFEEELETRLSTSRRHGTKGAVLVIDLDRFKPINDLHGHQAGDRVLEAIAAVLVEHTRKSDLAARLGGDEFAMLLDHTDAVGAAICANRVLAAIRNLVIPFGAVTLTVGASIGIATFPDDATTLAMVVSAADTALYRAKRGGRDRAVHAGTRALGSGELERATVRWKR